MLVSWRVINHGGLVQIIFLSKWVICRFQPLIFQGVWKWPSGRPGVLGSVKFFGRPGCLVWTVWHLGRLEEVTIYAPYWRRWNLMLKMLLVILSGFPPQKLSSFFLGGKVDITFLMSPDNQNRSEVCFPAWFPTQKNHQDLCRMSISGWNSGSFRMSPCCFLDDSRPLLVHPTGHLRARRNASWQPQARMATRRRTPFGAKPTAKGGFSWDVVLLSFLFC